MAQEVLQNHLWINNALFEKVLRDNNDESIFIKTFQVVQSSSRSQNYWCDIIRVLLNYTNSSNQPKSQNIILKIAFYDPYMQESIEKYDPFKRELFFYHDLLPKIKELQKLIDDRTEFTAKAFSIVNMRPQPKYLILEDFSRNHFKKVDRKFGFDEKHLKAILTKLATLHACSAVLYTNDKQLFSHHQEPNISEYFKMFHLLFLNCVHLLADEIAGETYEGAQRLANKLYSFERNMIDKASEAFMLEDDEFGVLCHGDLWLNNLLFHYDDEGHPIDVKLTDFGLSYFGSPGIDLSYLLFTSTNDSYKDAEIDLSLQHYHQALHENLIKLNYRRPIPTLTQIHNHFLKRGIIGVIYSFLLLPMRYGGQNVPIGYLSKLVKDSDEAFKFRKQFYGNLVLKERLRFLLSYYDRKGLLD